MSLVLNTNMLSLNAQNSLNNTQSMLTTSMQRLSSGLRINSAADDAAGYAISQRMTTQINGYDQAGRNANDAVSLVQTAEGSMNQITSNLQRIRELAVQSANATNSSSDRAALNTEAQQLMAENNRIAQQTQFNGVNLLDGSFSNKVFQVGANVGDTITIGSIANVTAANLGTSQQAKVTGAAATDFSAVTAGDLTINGTSVGGIAADTSATGRAASLVNAVNSVSDTTGVYAINDTATTVTLVSTSGAIAVAQSGTATAATTGLTAGSTALTSSTGYASMDLSTVAGANTAISQMDAALDAVNSAQATMGAFQNRFQSVVSNLQTTQQNITAARSQITDANFAQETANMTKANIMQQAGVAMVAQANQLPQLALKLLQ